MLEMDFVPSERKPGEDGAHVKSIKSIKSWDSTASTHAQDVFQLRTEVTEDLSPKAWNTDVVEANHDLETGANAECSEAPVKRASEEKVPETSRKQKEVWYVLMTVLYFVYRSQEESIFTPAAFSLRWNDLVGLIFIGSFLLTRKPSYLVYAINPFRNLVMILLQTIWPRMKAEETNPEYYRNIASASIQLCSAYAIWLLTTPQPIEVGTRWAEMSCLERWSTCFQGRLSCLKKWLMRVDNFLLVATGIAACLIAMKKQTHEFHSLHTEDHGWKIILSVVLGVAEEVTWRSVYMADNNNAIQAFTWGVNHIVAGTGMSNPWLYGVVSGSYAFCLGATPYVLLRFFHHAAVEYFVIDNLVKPEGHPIWLTQSVV